MVRQKYPQCALSENALREIRENANKLTTRQLADCYMVSVGVVQRVRRGTSYLATKAGRRAPA